MYLNTLISKTEIQITQLNAQQRASLLNSISLLYSMQSIRINYVG